MHATRAIILTLAILDRIATAPLAAPAAPAAPPVPVAATSAPGGDVELRVQHPLLSALAEKLVEEFAADAKPAHRVIVQSHSDSYATAENFAKGQCQLILHLNKLEDWEQSVIYQAARDMTPGNLEGLDLGQMKVVVIAHPKNAITQITFEQLQSLLAEKGRGTDWPALGGAKSGGKVVCYAESKTSVGRSIMRDVVMRFIRDEPGGGRSGGFYLYRVELAQCDGAADVIESVAHDENGLGFMLHSGEPPKTVKSLAVSKGKAGPFIAPKAGPQPDYPLAMPLVLYVHPKGGSIAGQFSQWCAGPNGAKTIREFLSSKDGSTPATPATPPGPAKTQPQIKPE